MFRGRGDLLKIDSNRHPGRHMSRMKEVAGGMKKNGEKIDRVIYFAYKEARGGSFRIVHGTGSQAEETHFRGGL